MSQVLKYSSLNFHTSEIFKLYVKINRTSVWEHPLVSQAVETVATIDKSPVTFDIVPVLAYVQ